MDNDMRMYFEDILRRQDEIAEALNVTLTPPWTVLARKWAEDDFRRRKDKSGNPELPQAN
ncbi:MAG TPA: hypothetical protein ENJ18_05205 [Nannocystis exedens]|nr:hypothetical protein [Nannocystis exedens]